MVLFLWNTVYNCVIFVSAGGPPLQGEALRARKEGVKKGKRRGYGGGERGRDPPIGECSPPFGASPGVTTEWRA